jgi:AcrR family transcriptional regulator
MGGIIACLDNCAVSSYSFTKPTGRSSMPQKEDLKEMRKEQILNAACVVFARQGFHNARMDDIVQEAGLSKGAVYWYFKSKDEIITSIVDRFFDRELVNIIQTSQLDDTVEKRLTEIARQLAAEIESISDLMPILLEFYAVACREDLIRDPMAEFTKRHLKLFEDLIMEGIQRGEFREVDPRDVAISVFTLLDGLMFHWMLGTINNGKRDLEGLFLAALELIVNGLKSEG